MNAEGRNLAASIAAARPLLTRDVAEDSYLSGVASRYESHRFLGRSAQAVFQRRVNFLARILSEFSGQSSAAIRILDWGCGKGQISHLLRKQGFDVTACDRKLATIDSAFGQEVPIISERDIQVIPLDDDVRMPFEEATFDCVTSFGVLEHVPHDLSSLREIRRVLKPNGILFITFLPYVLSWSQALAKLRGNDYHDRLYWRRDLMRLADMSGYDIHMLSFAQLFPKNSVPLSLDRMLEPLDQGLCKYSPLKFFATNLEAVLVAR